MPAAKKGAKKAAKKAAKKTAKKMTPKQVVKAVEKAWNENRLDKLDALFVQNYDAASRVPMLPPGLESAKMAHQMSMASFPDRKTEILDIFGEGNRVCLRMRVTGTNTGGVPWIGAPPNDSPIDFEWISIYEVKNGKVANHWGINDINTLMMQTGVWSPPAM